MNDFSLREISDFLRATPAMQAKKDIQKTATWLHTTNAPDWKTLYALPGDDCAAIATGDGYQLLAMEGMLPGFVRKHPWFAGWSAVMANVSDITAMGGRATAVVNAYWHHNANEAAELMRGMRDACAAYGVLLAGGHTSMGAETAPGLAVAIMGHARRLLSSLHVEPGQLIVMATDLNGRWQGDAPYWKAFEEKPAELLRNQLEVIPRLTEAGRLRAAKDISNAGILGSLLMLLEPTGAGADIRLEHLPQPDNVDLLRWLQVFPSYGFLLTLESRHWPDVEAAFRAHGIESRVVGVTNASGKLNLYRGAEEHSFWNFHEQSFTGFRYPTPVSETTPVLELKTCLP